MASVILAGTTSTTALNLTGDTSGELQLKTNNGSTTAMTLTTGGNVGIGTSSPAYKLDITGTARTTSLIDVNTAYTSQIAAKFFTDNTSATGSVLLIRRGRDIGSGAVDAVGLDCLDGALSGVVPLAFRSTTMNLIVSGANPFIVSTNGSERMRIDSSGNVGIGTSSPNATYRLDVVGNAGIRIQGGTTGKIDLRSASGNAVFIGMTENAVADRGVIGFAAGSGDMQFRNNGAYDFSTGNERMRITSGGNVGIGTSSPSSNLVVNSSTATQFDLLTNGTRYFSAYTDASQVILGGIQNTIVSFRQNDVERMQLDTSGNLRFNSGYGSVATAYGCRAWVTFNGTGTPAIRASGNVSSIVDYGTGDYGVLFSTSMPDGNYSLVGAAVKTGGGPSGTNSAVVTMGESPSTAGTGVGVLTVDGTAVDRAYVYAAFFR